MADGYVDGVATAQDANTVIQGNGGTTDKIAGGAGEDRLQGHAGFNQYYGGQGDDTFIISAKFAVASAHEGASKDYADQFAFITDFQGAGGWSATNNDFVALTGWGAGSHIDVVGTGTSGTNGATLYYYTITDGQSGATFNMAINSVNGLALTQNDFAFY